MRLFAAIVPPFTARKALRETVRAVRPDGAGSSAPKRGLLGRRGGQPALTDGASNDELVVPALEQMYLPITHFGNVTLGDSVHLRNALRSEAQGWGQPTVHFAGGGALEFPGDESVWAKLDGDLDNLNIIGRGVPHIVQRLGFFVDRRQFRPWLSVGTITETTTAPYLEGLVAALDGFTGESWTIETVTLMKRLPEEGNDAFEPMEEMPLGG
jgi:2'-5' RNA ligase